jgi:hypothetical protein
MLALAAPRTRARWRTPGGARHVPNLGHTTLARAAPPDSVVGPGDAAIDKPHARIIIDWQARALRST